MAKVRHFFSGANSCYGFYSLYDYMAPPTVKSKIILKGGPGTGKSTFMKKIAADLSARQINTEHHWCSSDHDSLDGLVAGQGQICVLDGTAPHVVDPRLPGAVEHIINLGEYWDAALLKGQKEQLAKLTDSVSRCFTRAYNRLAETRLALSEWEFYIDEAGDSRAINRNLLALAEEFFSVCSLGAGIPRHLFAGAICPGGIISKADSLLENDFLLLGVKGSPGSGSQKLLQYVAAQLELMGLNAEILHCPFDPEKIDMILCPENKAALVDFSALLIDYASAWPSRKFKRFLDFDQLLDQSLLDSHAKAVFDCRERFIAGLQAAVAQIKMAKTYHDELESYYLPAMDFPRIETMRQKLLEELLTDL